jgi:hypothetical protein
MSKAILKYDLSDPMDRQDFMRATKALDMASCLFAIQNLMRSYRKREDLPNDAMHVVDKLSEELYDLYNDYNIDLDNLIS